MNNIIKINFKSFSKTNLNKSVESNGISFKSETSGNKDLVLDYPIKMSVYLRQKDFPFSIISTVGANTTIGNNGTNP